MIISPDTQRAQRVPPGQSRTMKWPVLDGSGPPVIDLARWRFRLRGLVEREAEWTWEEFLALPRVKVFADFHCVTRALRVLTAKYTVSEIRLRIGSELSAISDQPRR